MMLIYIPFLEYISLARLLNIRRVQRVLPKLYTYIHVYCTSAARVCSQINNEAIIVKYCRFIVCVANNKDWLQPVGNI